MSSSKIRQFLLQGNVQLAREFLGRAFFYQGVVVRGEGRGHQLGFPTANLKLEEKLSLPYGSYATQVLVGKKIFPSVTNIGVRPTFGLGTVELPALVETHLLDLLIDLYGVHLEVRFIARLREERKFDTIEQLKTQIFSDIQATKKILDIA